MEEMEVTAVEDQETLEMEGLHHHMELLDKVALVEDSEEMAVDLHLHMELPHREDLQGVLEGLGEDHQRLMEHLVDQEAKVGLEVLKDLVVARADLEELVVKDLTINTYHLDQED